MGNWEEVCKKVGQKVEYFRTGKSELFYHYTKKDKSKECQIYSVVTFFQRVTNILIFLAVKFQGMEIQQVKKTFQSGYCALYQCNLINLIYLLPFHTPNTGKTPLCFSPGSWDQSPEGRIIKSFSEVTLLFVGAAVIQQIRCL